jgi:pyruvate kinase
MERENVHVAVMLDTKGPEIRTGFYKEGVKTIDLKQGQDLEVKCANYDELGDNTFITCTYDKLPQSVQVGKEILVADGALTLTVKEVKETSVICVCKNDATLGARKNMNIPGCKVDLPVLGEKDVNDIRKFALVQGVDMIAASFVQSKEDVQRIRKELGARGRNIQIMSKIENQEGILNFNEILEECDAIMVARGDMGMEIPPEKVFLAQKMMIRKCNVRGKPVVTATEMLNSMIDNPRPTRAECTDVANAVLDGTDCVMLSGESANGKFPIEAVTMMSKICVEAESVVNYTDLYANLRQATLDAYGDMSTQEAIASSAVKTAIDMNAKMVVVLTETGTTARLVAKYRPQIPILVLTALADAARNSCGLLRGTEAQVMGSMIGTDSILTRACEIGKDRGWVKTGDSIVAVHGMQEARAGSTNILKVLCVE